MAEKFLELTMTDSVRASQQKYYGALRRPVPPSANDALSEPEIAFIRSRDSFYLATLSENDWPYIQHRGGPPGFLHVLSAAQLAFADFKGNRQLISTGNLARNDRVCLFLMDYSRRARLKILGRAKMLDARAHPELVVRLAGPELRRVVERIFIVDVVAFDWNCPQHIVPRFTADEVADTVAPLKRRIAELEQQVKGKS